MSEPKPISSQQNDVKKTASWRDLFETSSSRIVPARFRVIRKHGEPLLILPNDTRCAAQSLALYPAQSPHARFARNVARLLLSLGVPVVREQTEVSVGLDDPLTRLIGSVAKSDHLPKFAILNGNPRTPGRRFIILVFDTNGSPSAVFKAGTDALAKALVLREAAFLKSVKRPGIPIVIAECVTESVAAFAMDFVAGDSPRGTNSSQVAEQLSSWLDRKRTIAIGESAQWKQLQQAAGRNLPDALADKLANQKVHPCIAHGDFAPWNAKVKPDNSWTVLDWERGELAGIPGWDWFHFVIQPLVLSEKRSSEHIATQIETFLRSHEFRTYADAAGIAGLEKPLLQSYLAWMLHVIRPTEGAATLEELLKWFAKVT